MRFTSIALFVAGIFATSVVASPRPQESATTTTTAKIFSPTGIRCDFVCPPGVHIGTAGDICHCP